MDKPLVLDNSDIPIRLFKSDFLEFFTHVHPITIIIIWVPFSYYMLKWGMDARPADSDLAYIPVCFLIAVFFWTFVEYNAHRFFFHFHPHTPLQERIVFLLHGVHHAQPRLKTRLVLPPALSIPMVAFFLGFFYFLAGSLMGHVEYVGPLVSGFTIGYLAYDLLHYATHHFPMRWGYLKYLKRHHMMHHYIDPDMRFGVSSPLWDWVYGTMPKE